MCYSENYQFRGIIVDKTWLVLSRPIDLLNIDYYAYNIMFSLQSLTLSGDIETNPGPEASNTSCASLSIMHQNIRSIRHKLEYIRDNC